jgi:hypothetical protein
MTILDQCLLDLGISFILSFLFYPLRNAKCVSTILKSPYLPPAINISVLTSIIIQVHIHTRLLINKCVPLGKYKIVNELSRLLLPGEMLQ